MNALVALLLACTSSQAAVVKEDKIDPKWKRLYAEAAQSSSFLKSNWNKYEENYHPNYILDDDPRTAWVKGGEGDGSGETISWQVSPLKSADHVLLRIRNGYQKTEKLFKANSSVKELEVTLLNSAKREVFKGTFPLKKAMGWQNLEITVPKSAGFSSVTLKVVSVYPGAIYKDLCISDVQTYVESKVPYDANGEKSKWARLRAWIKTRLSTAKYFSTKPAEFPFAVSSLSELGSDRADDPMPEYDDQGRPKPGGLPPFYQQMKAKKASEAFRQIFSPQDLERAAKLLERGQRLKGSSRWYSMSLSPKAKKVRKPDFSGKDEYLVHDVSEVLALYSMPAELSYFPTDKAVAKTEEHNDGDSGLKRVESNVKIEKDPSGATTAVYFWRKEIGEERGIWESQRNFLVHYNQLKHVESILVWSHTKEIDLNPQQIKAELAKPAEDIEPSELFLVTPAYDSHGKIESVTAQAAHHDTYEGQANWYELGRWGKPAGVLSLNP